MPDARRHDVVVDGKRIAYLDTGDDDVSDEPACVLIHGLAASWDYWVHTVPALATGRRVVAIDLPGFGRSERRDEHGIDAQIPVFAEFCDALGLNTVDLVGHSMGTLVACELAARYPERVRRMVLTGGPILSVVDLFTSPVRTLRRNPQVASFLVEAVTAGIPLPATARKFIVANSFARKAVFRAYVPHPEKLSDDVVAGVLHGVGAPGVLPTLVQGFGYDMRPALRALTAPTLVVAGARDTIAPVSDAHAFASLNPAVERVDILDGVGHWAMLEAPEVFNALALEHLTR